MKIYILRPQPGPVAKNATLRPLAIGIELALSGSLDQRSTNIYINIYIYIYMGGSSDFVTRFRAPKARKSRAKARDF